MVDGERERGDAIEHFELCFNTMDDMKGLKLRVPERDYYVKSITAFGAKPTPIIEATQSVRDELGTKR